MFLSDDPSAPEHEVVLQVEEEGMMSAVVEVRYDAAYKYKYRLHWEGRPLDEEEDREVSPSRKMELNLNKFNEPSASSKSTDITNIAHRSSFFLDDWHSDHHKKNLSLRLLNGVILDMFGPVVVGVAMVVSTAESAGSKDKLSRHVTVQQDKDDVVLLVDNG